MKCVLSYDIAIIQWITSCHKKDMTTHYITLGYWAQLFEIKDVISLHIVKTVIIKYGVNAHIFAEKMWVA